MGHSQQLFSKGLNRGEADRRTWGVDVGRISPRKWAGAMVGGCANRPGEQIPCAKIATGAGLPKLDKPAKRHKRWRATTIGTRLPRDTLDKLSCLGVGGTEHTFPSVGNILCAPRKEDETGTTHKHGNGADLRPTIVQQYSVSSDRSPVLASKSAPLLSRMRVVSSPPDLLAKCNGVLASSLSLACEGREKRNKRRG